MEGKYKTFCSWSGGKDSALALHLLMQDKLYRVEKLLTNVTAHNNRVTMHGVRLQLIAQQALAMALPLQTILLPFEPNTKEYEKASDAALNQLAEQGYTHGVFGDIFLEDLKIYRVKQLARFGMEAVFPLWQMESKAVLQTLTNSGFKMITVCVDASLLDQSFLGRIIDEDFINRLPPKVDACGENGEYHTFVFDGPLFKQPIAYKKGEVTLQAYSAPASRKNVDTAATMGFWLCDLLPAL
jgi:uncharacterized protein (TIGR00290 family)